MMSRTITLALAFVGLSLSALAQEEFPKPGPQQELLSQMAGEWDAQMTCNFPGTDGPVESTGTYTAKMDVGGYFLVAEYVGKFADQPFQGRSITGYDPFKEQFTGVWVDSMGPALYNIRGKFDKQGKTYIENMTGPGPDGKPMKFRNVIKLEDDDHMQMTMYIHDEEGKEQQLMQVKYTRK